MSQPVVDHLAQIVERKKLEVARRLRRKALFSTLADQCVKPAPQVAELLRRRDGQPPRVIAEIKLRSPSAGQIRPRRTGELTRIARGYEEGGASAVSVLCDGPGFGGSPLDLRRVAAQVAVPVLFKEFVIDEVQLDAARAVGARLVLLLVCVLDDRELNTLIAAARERGLEPIVEAASEVELRRALATTATILGINARDLHRFTVDPLEAARLVNLIPPDRVAVFMSGVRTSEDFERVAGTRADAVLIGEGLMRAEQPGAALAALIAAR